MPQGPEQSVMGKVGVDPGYVKSRAMGRAGNEGADRVCARFWTALILAELVSEVPLDRVAASFGVDRGALQGLQDRAARFAGMAAAFCERIGWHDLEALIAKFQVGWAGRLVN